MAVTLVCCTSVSNVGACPYRVYLYLMCSPLQGPLGGAFPFMCFSRTDYLQLLGAELNCLLTIPLK